MLNEIEVKIRRILQKNLETQFDVSKIGLDDELVTLGINSILFIKMVIEIESEFGVNFDDEKLDFYSLTTLASIIKYTEDLIK